ncbi:hypothetical protein LMH87_003078 [Akanthomyces muscarius]|uniref:Uncharacterized protein n=1 Tax=Akanthomyces muscarius TaxID=2231603 RepID=A0A9W8QA52_AKAMU|nr:hypothetical protein LMH87_003078 [Akanthomyces muscarius]KAJ4148616.1 hypothetical protein LMH87_003078 [Akanthomyces muscarius]
MTIKLLLHRTEADPKLLIIPPCCPGAQSSSSFFKQGCYRHYSGASLATLPGTHRLRFALADYHERRHQESLMPRQELA